jgi:hypothetical protein
VIGWALRDPEERMVDFEEIWAIPQEAFVSRDGVGVVAAGVEEAYTILKGGIAYFKKRNMRFVDNNNK